MLVVEALADLLVSQGVRHVFGIPGKESVRLAVELERRGVTFVSARHETQAVMMADGYWRASGQVGVALVSQGPGFANAINGLACALKARSGVVLIAGDLFMNADNPRARAIQDLKGIDHQKVCEALGVPSVRPTSADNVAAEVREALAFAATGMTLALNIPSNMFGKQAGEGPSQIELPLRAPIAPDPEQLETVADLLTTGWAANRPVILAGRGAVQAGAVPALRRLGDLIGAVLATSLPARSAFGDEPFAIGVCGTFASPVALDCLLQADCILSFGASLNPLTTYGGDIFPKGAQIIQVDAAAEAMAKFCDVGLEVEADARQFAEALVNELERRGHSSSGYRTDQLAETIAGWRASAGHEDQSIAGFIDPRTLMIEINEIVDRDRIVAIDAGLHLFNACTFLDVAAPRDFLFPIETISIGLGLGAAIGAAFAQPGRPVLLETGDGGFMMSMNDLETAARYGLPLIVVVSNDEAWGAEAQHLQTLGLPDSCCRLASPDLAALARDLGADGHTIRSVAELRALRPILAALPPRPILLDCRIHPGIQSESAHFDYAGVRREQAAPAAAAMPAPLFVQEL
jgi:thiamine pyrophosphate-dependent acetolactate synthase large subunit-like protein